jgi:limonene-1,2-epoxide hydrolase
MSGENVDVIRRLNVAFNADDWDEYQKLLAPDLEFVDHMPLPDVAQSARGVDEVKTVLDQWREGFSGFHAEVLEYQAMGEYVICSTRWDFTSRDGAIELKWTGAEAHQVQDGLIVWSAVGFPDVGAAIQAVEDRQAG